MFATQKLSTLIGLGFIIRLCVLYYGVLQDASAEVKYTDVDYHVYMDAAKHVVEGNSPFERHTYRYTPLIAYMMVPSVLIHPALGKILFVVSDLVVGWMIYYTCVQRGAVPSDAIQYTSSWVLNPLVINISTRGNADSLACLLVVSTVYFMTSNRPNRLTVASLLYGLSVHFRIFPIVFAPTFVFFIGRNTFPDQMKVGRCGSWFLRIKFGVISGSVFIALGLLFYVCYGYQFLYESYLYHFVRADTRHNFSAFFYSLYLQREDTATFAGLLSFLPHFVLQAALVIRFHKDLGYAICLQTITFVAFNKVCTAQYFLWYISMLPLALPSTDMKVRSTGIRLLCAWFLAEFHWLYWAYYLEFEGSNTFFSLWIAGLLFFSVNVALLYVLMRSYTGSHSLSVAGKSHETGHGDSIGKKHN